MPDKPQRGAYSPTAEELRIEQELDALIHDALNDTDIIPIRDQADLVRRQIAEVQAKRNQQAINARISQKNPREAKQYHAALSGIAGRLDALKADLRALDARADAEDPQDIGPEAPEEEQADDTANLGDFLAETGDFAHPVSANHAG